MDTVKSLTADFIEGRIDFETLLVNLRWLNPDSSELVGSLDNRVSHLDALLLKEKATEKQWDTAVLAFVNRKP